MQATVNHVLHYVIFL